MSTATLPPPPLSGPQPAYRLPDVFPDDFVDVSQDDSMARPQVGIILEKKKNTIKVYEIATQRVRKAYYKDHPDCKLKPHLFQDGNYFVFDIGRPTKRVMELEAKVTAVERVNADLVTRIASLGTQVADLLRLAKQPAAPLTKTTPRKVPK